MSRVPYTLYSTVSWRTLKSQSTQVGDPHPCSAQIAGCYASGCLVLLIALYQIMVKFIGAMDAKYWSLSPRNWGWRTRGGSSMPSARTPANAESVVLRRVAGRSAIWAPMGPWRDRAPRSGHTTSDTGCCRSNTDSDTGYFGCVHPYASTTIPEKRATVTRDGPS